MRLVPVLDIRRGVVVHARRGERQRYAPLHSALVADGAPPAEVARVLTAACGTDTVYVADLDAIAGAPVDEAAVMSIAAVARPWVDAGAVDSPRAAALARSGAARNVIGTESLGDDAAGRADPQARSGPGDAAPAAVPRILSVDLRDGRLISPRRRLSGREPLAAAPLAAELGVAEVLVIDLALVGSGAGPAIAAVRRLAQALPGVAVYAGGGVRGDEDLAALEQAGAAGALVATALHEGRLTVSR